MIQRIPPDLCQLLNVIYLPQLGCLVAVHDLLNPDIVPSDWEQQVSYVRCQLKLTSVQHR